MASFTLDDLGGTFPDGTTVGAYPASAWSGRFASGAPLGSATSSQSVTNQSATFTGLTADTDYYAAGDIGDGTYRYVHFHVPENDPGVELGYAEITSDFTRTGAGASDVTGLSVTAEVGERPIVVEFGCGGLSNTNAAGLSAAQIYEGATKLAQVLGGVGTSSTHGATRSVRLNPAAGSHTYKIVVGQLVLGNTVIDADVDNPAYIRVTEV